VLADGEALHAQVCALRHARVVAFARLCDLPGRHAGVSSDELLRLFTDGGFDLCLVKADGARGRVIKAPAGHEPPLSPHSALVVPVVSARAIGMPLTGKLAHRPECVAAAAGLEINEVLTPIHIGRLLASERGALKDVGVMPVVPMINMVDDAGREALAREAAAAALSLTNRFDRVVLGAMTRANPLVAVVHR
jgi:probable selenium-dependent hydroxylase accessory protein YqeC